MEAVGMGVDVFVLWREEHGHRDVFGAEGVAGVADFVPGGVACWVGDGHMPEEGSHRAARFHCDHDGAASEAICTSTIYRGGDFNGLVHGNGIGYDGERFGEVAGEVRSKDVPAFWGREFKEDGFILMIRADDWDERRGVRIVFAME
jgi:hypothetical protein